MECNIKDFESVLVIDGKTHGIAKIEPLTSSFKFFTTVMYNDGEDVRARTFKLTKQDAKTFLENYGNTTLYVGINFGGGPGVLLKGVKTTTVTI